MKISMMSYAMGSASPREIVATAAACGMQAVDWITLHGESPRVLKQLCDDAGLAVAAHTPLNESFIQGRSDGLDEFRRSLEAAVTLAAPVIMVPPFPLAAQRSMADAQARWRDFYGRALPYVQEAGLQLCIESTGFINSPLVTGEEIKAVLDAVPGLKVAFDNGNTSTACDMRPAFELLKDHVVHFHLKDWRITAGPAPFAEKKRDGRYFADCVIGEGDLPLAEFWQQQVAPVYNGFVNLETCDPSGKRSPQEVMQQACRHVRSVIAPGS